MKNRRLTLRQKRAITGLLFILPWLIGFSVYYVRSLVLTIQFSLSSIDIVETGGYTAKFIGLDNFKHIFTEHATFNETLTLSLKNMIMDVPFIIFFSFFIAILLNSKFKGRTLVRAIFFLPILLNSGAIMGALQHATETIQGGASSTIAEMSVSSGVNIDYLVDMLEELGLSKVLMGYIIGLVSRLYDVVRASSVQIIIFIAALQSVSPSLYEVSKIEGATSYETFWKVTFPMVSPLILTNTVYTIVDSFVNSQVVNVAYSTAFSLYNYGLSSAMSLASTVIVCCILLFAGGLINKFIFYYN